MSDRLLKIISKADAALQGAESATIARVNAALESSYKQLEKQLLSAYDKHQGNLSLLPKQRSLVILDEVSTLLSLVNPRNSETIQTDLQNLLQAADDQGATLADGMVRAIANEKLANFASVPLEAVRMQAENGLKRLSRHTEEFRTKSSAIVELGLVQGHGSRRMATALRSQLGITKGNAERLARTEAVSSHNQAIAANLQRNGYDLVQVFATVDDRVCATCAARNQNIYKINEISAPFHPFCRCVIVPMSQRWIDAGLVDEAWSRRFKETAIAELAKQGKKPGYGVSSFEKASGLTQPPTPIWKP